MITELIALNKLLAARGIKPRTSPDSTHPDAIAARDALDTINREVQGDKTTTYNRDKRTLSLDSSNNIILPANTLRVDAVDRTIPVAQRGQRLYNTATGTFVFDTSVVCWVSVLLPFDDLPFHAANYIMYRAALDHYVDQEGQGEKVESLRKRAEVAQVNYERIELQVIGPKATESPQAQSMLNGIGSSGRDPNKLGG